MVGNTPKEDILISCKATAMIYNDGQKKWLHCASNGPAKIQLLFSSDTQSYRIVGRQIQDHEVVLNHSITKGIKYNQATPTFHQWRDQTSVYGLNFSSKLDAQEFGTTMLKILDNVNGLANNSSSQMIINGGATLPSSSSTMNNNNNNDNNNYPPSYRRQSSQPPSSVSSNTTIVSVNSSSEIQQQQQQQQQQYSSSPYTSHLRQNSNPLISTPSSINNSNYYTQQHQSTEEDETNYALISDSYSYYTDNSANKNNNIPPAPPLNLPMSNSNGAPPPPPPPPPLPNGFGNGPPPAPALNLSNSNSTATGRKTNTTSSAPPMDLMSEMAAKFAQRRKCIDENEKTETTNLTNNKTPSKLTTTLPPTAAGPATTSPRVGRKANEPSYTSIDWEKFKTDILAELRKDIEKAKQEILNAILDNQNTKI